MTQLNARQQQVLWATIRHYVTTAEPVGSKALIEAYGLKVSPATVRNVMGVLERSGLLYQPHPSAGRIPSDSGYRTYVDELIQPSKPVARRVDRTLAQQLTSVGRSVEGLLRETAKILAMISGYIALVTLPTAEAIRLRHVQLVQVGDNQVLLVVLLDSNHTESVLIQLPDQGRTDGTTLERELQMLSNFLTEQLQGCTLSAIATLDWGELNSAFEHYATAIQGAINNLQRRQQQATQIVISGLAEALHHPEFSNSDQIRNLLALLEDAQQLSPLIAPLGAQTETLAPTSPLHSPLQIWIGSENPLEPMRSCALISSTYRRDSTPLGSVGILGPTRMLYEDAIAAVEAAAAYLSEALSQAA